MLNCCAGARVSSCAARPSWRNPVASFLLRLHSKHDHRRGVAHVCRAASESPHRILGVAPSASEADIKRAYRKLALQYHPDVNKAPDAQQRFMSIKSAYQALLDPNFRAYSPTANQSSREVDPFSWDYSTSGVEDPDEYYGLGDVWGGLQSSFEDFFGDLQASFNRISAASKPRSLWEELSDIGEEFVEFLEKELNIFDDVRKVMEDDNNVDYGSRVREKSNVNNWQEKYEQGRKLEVEINEIEEMLAKLRQDLGL